MDLLISKCEALKNNMNNLYKFEKIDGKGFGCIALKDIKKGTLILEEKPQCACVNDIGSEEKWTSELFSRLLKNFYTMSPSDQSEFLKLHTSNGFSKEELGRKINLASLEDHFINDISLKIYGIYETNKFNKGVAIRASRFNHSCVANAENVWNHNDSRIEFKASKKIKKGEEITINYLR